MLWLGVSLIVAGLLLPFAVLFLRAARWQPPAAIAEDALVLRPELVIIPAGKFQMGSPADEADRNSNETQHEVEITKPFAMARTEVTQGQYFAVMGARPVESTGCKEAGVGDDLPVVCIDWLEAVKYCNELSTREKLEIAYPIEGEKVTWNREASGYRLPTEAEWEYAARAGTRTRWVGTGAIDDVCKFDNVGDASAKERYPNWTTFGCNDGFPTLSPVAAHKVNRWQLYGLGGNAAEWVWDFFGDYPAELVVDPSGVESASYRVIRGGSWWYEPRNTRVADRYRVVPSRRHALLGFRVARSLPSDF